MSSSPYRHIYPHRCFSIFSFTLWFICTLIWREANAIASGRRLIRFPLLFSPLSLSFSELGSDFRMPCVLFTGHPSLRMGDVVHFMENWSQNPANCIIFTGVWSVGILKYRERQEECDALLLFVLPVPCYRCHTCIQKKVGCSSLKGDWSLKPANCIIFTGI